MSYAVVTTDRKGHSETNIIGEPDEVLERYGHLLAHPQPERASVEVFILQPWAPTDADLLDAADSATSKTSADALRKLADGLSSTFQK